MQPSSAPLTHKLILATLLLILVCLVVIVARSFRDDSTGQTARDGESKTAVAALDKRRDNEPVDLVPPWKTNSSRSYPTNRLTFQPARTASTSPLADAPEPRTPPQGFETLVSPVAASDARSALATGNATGVAYTGPASVVGRVTLRGEPPQETPIEMGPVCGSLHKGPATTRHYVVGRGGGLGNVFVFLHPPSSSSSAGIDELISLPVEGSVTPLEGTVLVDQKGCMFQPYVTAMHLGQVLAVRNSDRTLHNLHLTPRRNRERNIGQPGQQINEFRFEYPEAFIRIKCDVHPWMFTYVSVVPHPYFAITEASSGLYRIPANLPGGKYVVTACHLKLGSKSKEITFPNPDPIDFEFNVSEIGKQAPMARPRL